ncbi:hypothetical protein ACIBED_17365 [Rhodococcus coprophilus]|uniref:Hypothetical membrane protein n=1 Tax=Rhodococcus coprophilus TaxID=38310 RepID=A0A2X4XBY6_9NOCA|nr:hypothetical protein [Rhodococcus coprophilus]MBM7459765.1 hypothetical protein [Rhodococcus coprophilus]SQI37295.1 hypothetical membrane protein [Rhodococcus coprophilus]
MTENHRSDTGQVSVAELLARNGQKVSSRSGGRRRRGSSGGISVAELTGEIPITRNSDPAPSAARSADDAPPQVPKVEPVAPSVPQVEFVVPETPRVEPVVPVTPRVEVPELVTPAPPSPTELTTVTVRPDFGTPAATPKSGLGTKPTIASRSTSAPRSPASASRSAASSSAAAASTSRSTPAVSRSSVATPTSPASASPSVASASRSSAATVTPDREAPKVESPTEVIRPAALPRRARAHLGLPVSEPQSAPVPVPRAADVVEPRLLSGPASDLQGTGTEDENETTDAHGFADPAETPRRNAPDASGEDAAAPARGGKRRRKSRDDAGDAVSPRRASPVKVGKPDDASGEHDTRDDEALDDADDASGGSNLKQWALLIAESVGAVAAGALLFKGFEMLWDMMPWVAFGLALLVIVGLVALVRILRRTDDIASQLIALAVGAFVAFGPLLFLMPNG